MTSITCATVQEQLELFALGECAKPAQPVIARHLAGCPDCRAALAEVRQVIDEVDLHLQAPARLERLQAVLAAEARPQRRRQVLPLFRRAAALAALLLLMLGLAGVIGPAGRDAEGLALALVSPVGMRGNVAEKVGPPAVAVAAAKDPVPGNQKLAVEVLRFHLAPVADSPAAFRRRLQEEVETDRLPPPPLVDLGLKLYNHSPLPVEIRLGDPGSELTMQACGPGAVTVPARNPLGQPFLTAGLIKLGPGQSQVLPLPRLVFGSPGHIHYAYWTEPGSYTLTVTYRPVVGPDPGHAVSPPGVSLRIEVEGQ